MSHATPVLSRKAEQVHAALKGAGYGFDPAALIAVITKIVALFAGCALSPQQAEKRAARPRLLDKLALRKIVRQHSSGENEEALTAALLDAGDDLTAEDVAAMYTETSN